MKLYELSQGAYDIDDQLGQTAKNIARSRPGTSAGLGPQANQGVSPGRGGMNPGGLDGQPGAALGMPGGVPGGMPGGGAGGIGMGGGGGSPGVSPGQPDENEPDFPIHGGDTDDDLEVDKIKSVDDATIAAVNGHPFWNYEFRNAKVTPEKILQMDMSSLHNLRSMVRQKVNMKSLHDQVGLYDRPDFKYFNDFMRFLDRVIQARKTAEIKTPDKHQPKRPTIQRQAEPKHSKMGEFKQKRPIQ